MGVTRVASWPDAERRRRSGWTRSYRWLR